MHNHPLCAHFVELPLSSVAGSGCFGWKSNWTKFDHVGNTGGYWETMSSSYFIWKFKVSVCLLYCFLAVVQLMNKISFLQI